MRLCWHTLSAHIPETHVLLIRQFPATLIPDKLHQCVLRGKITCTLHGVGTSLHVFLHAQLVEVVQGVSGITLLCRKPNNWSIF